MLFEISELFARSGAYESGRAAGRFFGIIVVVVIAIVVFKKLLNR